MAISSPAYHDALPGAGLFPSLTNQFVRFLLRIATARFTFKVNYVETALYRAGVAPEQYIFASIGFEAFI